ncbi:MAG: protein repA [Liquorilactobacillus nagelii]|uniref:protein repA n=1 Tax=Liquorilactobacillus TaxID=2767888 RepID=UPI0039ECFB59
MGSVEKKNVTLSLPVESDKKLEEMAKKYGMTKSGLVNFLINKAEEAGTIFGK